ncbi:EAL domain-containing protein [Thiohalocapsa marina]|uniref:EAL domain-containing protein n=1 Tax=Thiohalocapsa marina TaxID=424902 RepID=UPI0036DBA553
MTETDTQLQAIRQGLTAGEFIFHYQPQISLLTGKVCGAEALIRWQRDDTLVPPAAFIPLAERTGLITDITAAMFPRFVEDVCILHDMFPSLHVSMNITAQDLENDAFVDQVERVMGTLAFTEPVITFEITETTALGLLAENRRLMDRLTAMHIRLAMDDFGTGYSNLASLAHAPFAEVKLDKSLMDNILQDEKKRILIKDSVRMAHRLGIEVVGEGVETDDVLVFLQGIGCPCAQGFAMSRPLPLENFTRFADSWVSPIATNPIGILHLAQLDHIEWRKDTIDRALRFDPAKDDKRDLFTESRINPTQCMFGRWYHAVTSELAQLDAFKAIDEPHTELHLLGHQLLSEATKATRSNERLMALSRELTRRSLKLLALLHELESDMLERSQQ